MKSIVRWVVVLGAPVGALVAILAARRRGDFRAIDLGTLLLPPVVFFVVALEVKLQQQGVGLVFWPLVVALVCAYALVLKVLRFPAEGIAIARSRWSLEGHVGPDGATLPQRSGILTNVLQKSSRSWKIIDSQNTDIVEVRHPALSEHRLRHRDDVMTGLKVLASFEDRFRAHCVDVFVRNDGTFGFEEFRSESDGGGRWQSLAKYSQLSFASGDLALREAERRVSWLGHIGPWRG